MYADIIDGGAHIATLCSTQKDLPSNVRWVNAGLVPREFWPWSPRFARLNAHLPRSGSAVARKRMALSRVKRAACRIVLLSARSGLASADEGGGFRPDNLLGVRELDAARVPKGKVAACLSHSLILSGRSASRSRRIARKRLQKGDPCYEPLCSFVRIAGAIAPSPGC